MRRFCIIMLLSLIFGGSCASAQQAASQVKISNEIVRNERGEFYVHRVKPKETLFSISKAYNADVNQIGKDNPKASEGLKAGDILLIRRAGLTEQGEQNIDYTRHTVRWFESLESIAERYGVDVESIVHLNKLDGKQLKTRQILLIPDKDYRISSAPLVADDTKTDDSVSDVTDKEVPKTFLSPLKNYVHNISLIIPADSKTTAEERSSWNFIEFYQGFLLALNDAKESGISINIDVIDSKDYLSSNMIVSSGRIDRSELVIGPVFSSEIEEILPYVSGREITLVSPMDPTADKFVSGNPTFIQISVNETEQQRALLSSIPPDANIALFYEKGAREERMISVTEAYLQEMGIQYKKFSYGLLEGRSVREQLINQLDANRENYAIVLSNSEAFVSDILRNLNLITSRNGFKITLFGLPRWRNFESVDINYYHSMKLHLALQYYVDYGDLEVKRFLAKYRALFGTEPSPYSFQAYDLGKFFTEQIALYGKRIYEFAGKEPTHRLLQSDFKLQRSSDANGLSNFGTRIIVYRPDFSIELLAPLR